MVHIPVAQSLVAYFAPDDMRGRYMAAFGFTWAIPNIVAPTLAGLVMDNFTPQWVWYIAGLLAVVAAVAFFYLFIRTRHRFKKEAAPV
jgi:MFS family permease